MRDAELIGGRKRCCSATESQGNKTCHSGRPAGWGSCKSERVPVASPLSHVELGQA